MSRIKSPLRGRYYVTTWDAELQKFTPQKGVRTGPYTLFGLRKPIRQLKSKGYDCGRCDCSTRIERDGDAVLRRR